MSLHVGNDLLNIISNICSSNNQLKNSFGIIKFIVNELIMIYCQMKSRADQKF